MGRVQRVLLFPKGNRSLSRRQRNECPRFVGWVPISASPATPPVVGTHGRRRTRRSPLLLRGVDRDPGRPPSTAAGHLARPSFCCPRSLPWHSRRSDRT